MLANRFVVSAGGGPSGVEGTPLPTGLAGARGMNATSGVRGASWLSRARVLGIGSCGDLGLRSDREQVR